jgi:hypothetical protein
MKSAVLPIPLIASFWLPLAAAAGVACSTSSAGGGDASIPVAMCAHPGGPAAGPADDHCATGGPDGGALVEAVTLACNAATPADDGGGGTALACPYGATQFGVEADDDDCKYHLAWSSTPICETPGGTTFTLVATTKADGKPLTGAAPSVEVFETSPADCGADTPANCDQCTTHPGPNYGVHMTEGPPGTYVAPLEFDQKGAWTVRFHFFEKCTDAPNAPHGHVAFHIDVP